jgi:hypothetical protein
VGSVQGGRSRRPLAIGLALIVILAGVVLALVLTGDDEGEKSAATERAPSETDRPTVPKEVPTATETTPSPPPRDSRQIEQTVTTFVESAEQADSQRACSQVAGGQGKQLPGCAEAVGIDLRGLPSSDELQVDQVKVSGGRADATLSSGASFRLKQIGGTWKLSGFRPS